MQKLIIAIDPGAEGAIAVLEDGKAVAYNMPETYSDIYLKLDSIIESAIYEKEIPIVCYLEDVGKGMPGQSSVATA